MFASCKSKKIKSLSFSSLGNFVSIFSFAFPDRVGRVTGGVGAMSASVTMFLVTWLLLITVEGGIS